MNEAQLRMRYIGACALLARLSNRPWMDPEDLGCIKSALDDMVETLPGRFQLWNTGYGWSIEPKREVA